MRLTLLHSEMPKLYAILAFLSAVDLIQCHKKKENVYSSNTLLILDFLYIFSGIPEQADIANTYYSQFNEDFSPSDSEEDDQAQTVIPARKRGDSDDDADVMFGSDGASQLGSDVTLTKKDDEDELYNHLQYVLDKNEDGGMYKHYNFNNWVT